MHLSEAVRGVQACIFALLNFFATVSQYFTRTRVPLSCLLGTTSRTARRYERSVLVCSGTSRNSIAALPLLLLLFTSTLFSESATDSTANMKFSAVLPALMTLPLLASAHFTLDYPTSRGFDENIEPRASDGLTNLTRVGPPNRFDALLTEFCGGFPTPSSERTPFPLSGSAPVLIDSHHPSAIVGMFLSFDSNPTSFSQFNQTSSGQQYGLLDNFGSITGSGEVRNKFPRPRVVYCWPPADLARAPAQFCFQVDVASLGVGGLSNGSVATLQ